jgi:glycosyltransferase involved in cell wall biosynthesis
MSNQVKTIIYKEVVMSNPLKISVIVPAYNTAQYLRVCLDSICSSSFDDMEVIVVDDGSNDGVTPSICDTYAESDPRIRVIHKENGGLQSAWICGVHNSSAPYLCFIDSDDWIDGSLFGQLYSSTDSSHADDEIITSGYIIEKANEKKTELNLIPAGEYSGAKLQEINMYM